MVTLQTERLLLREWRQEDLDDFYEYARNPEVGPNAGWPPHTCKEDSQKILQRFIEHQEVWAIVHRESGKVIGSLGLHPDRKRENDRARMIGYVLSQDYWGHGLMPEAVRAVLRHAFEDLQLELVSVYHYPFNERSKAVILKAGFRLEGVLRRCGQRYDGMTLDDFCYSMTREEYGSFS